MNKPTICVPSPDVPAPERQQPSSTSAPEQQAPRRLIKRLKVKTSTTTTTTPEPTTTSTTTTTTTTEAPAPQQQFSSTYSPLLYGSTLRPVKRINVKTKVLGTRKIGNTFDSQVIPSASSTKNPFAAFEKLRKISTSTTTTTSTTPEPELITASDDEVLKRKSSSKLSTPFSDFTTPTTYRPSAFFLSNNNNNNPFQKKNSTQVVIKVTNKSQQQSAFPTPISFKEPILSSGKLSRKESRVEVKESIREESSAATKSPDYDYAYYNTDNDDDYANVEARRLADSKSYGKKPNGNNRKIALSASV
jgi:hypothetical protein